LTQIPIQDLLTLPEQNPSVFGEVLTDLIEIFDAVWHPADILKDDR
jgi:hypothetical protein